MNLDNQTSYWNRVAHSKTFTHPIDVELLKKYISPDSLIVDFGCGYGRIVKQLNEEGFTDVIGFDTSLELINRGRNNDVTNIFHIESIRNLPIANDTVNCIILFAVLTCIPSNSEQRNLITYLRKLLKPGGIIYISDYYLQQNSQEMDRYEYLNNDKENYGVFQLDEGVMFRHHTRDWIKSLFHDFRESDEKLVPVKTMNGNKAEAFQMVVMK